MPTGMKGMATDLLKDGGAGAIADYLYDTFVGPKIGSAVGAFAGNWTDTVLSFAVSLGIEKFWKNPRAHTTAVSLFSHRLAIALETQFPNLGGLGGGGSSASSANPLAPIQLA